MGGILFKPLQEVIGNDHNNMLQSMLGEELLRMTELFVLNMKFKFCPLDDGSGDTFSLLLVERDSPTISELQEILSYMGNRYVLVYKSTSGLALYPEPSSPNHLACVAATTYKDLQVVPWMTRSGLT